MNASDVSMVSTAVDYDPFADAALARVVPATASQREIWLAAKLEQEASLAYNESVSIRLCGELDVAALQAALQGVIDRHEALRATLSADGNELCIATHVALDVVAHDLSGLNETERNEKISAALGMAVGTPFDLEHGPLVRAHLLRLAEHEHLLIFTAHHIICDGWSFGVIVRDLAALYAQRLGQGGGAAPADAFTDYAIAETMRAQTDSGRDDEQYWLSRFGGALPSLDLPTDGARRRHRSFASQREDRTLDAALIADIKRMGARRGASFYATLLAAFSALLHRLSAQDDVVVGIPSAGQAADGKNNLVGHCVNVLPLRTAIDSHAPFATVLDHLRGDLLDAFEHRQYTLGSLLGRLAMPRDPGRLPLVSVLFNLDQALDERTVSFPGLRFEFAGNARAYENFELFVNAVQVGDGLRLECQYNSDLFRGETIRCWLDAYETLLRSAVATPDIAVQELSLLSEAAQRSIATLQPASTPYPEQKLAHEYFEQQADRVPHHAAVRDSARQLSYAQLEARANRLARVLRERGVARGDLVGIALARSADMVVAVLAVLKAGAGYVPLDPQFPADRLAFMADDAALASLIVDDVTPQAFQFPPSRVLSLKHDADAIESASTARLPRDDAAATPDSVAYVIFTSGSTGRPKGVRVPHRTTSNFLTGMQRVPGIAEDDRLVAVTTLSFDIAFMELMLPLSAGAEVIIADRDDVRDGAALRRLVEQSDATMMQATPSGWRILIEAGWHGRERFRAISGGEPLAVDLAEALLQRCNEVWNGYGPTETTVYSTYWRVTHPRAGIFIGRPVANTQIHVLDEQRAPCPLGVPGEIYIGGAGVTLGYLNRPELDAERFLPDPFVERSGARMYRTGDRGRWLANGMVEHLGRLDFQVKVRGYRIELGEIESVLADVPEVDRAVVIAREDRPGDVRLVAYVVMRDHAGFDETGLREQLKRRLPDYMVPQHVIELSAIPLLPNGKTDRKALPAPHVHSVASETARIAPRTDDERRVAAAMESVLSLPDLDVRDDFFALGGHSLLAAQLTARLNREFGITLSFRTLFDAPTIAELAAAIHAQVVSGATPAAQPITRRADQSRAPLSLMQSRLWSLEELQPGRVTYNAPSAHRLRGHLDEAAFQLALRALIQRQPILRTAFRRDGQAVEQIVASDIDVPLFPAEDLSGVPETEREAALMRRLQAITDTPFDLTQAPLFSARMFRLGDDDHVFFFMPHHIIWDGWSFDILYAELSSLYRAFVEGAPSPLAPLPVSYGDFAAWHTQWLEGPQFQTQLAYWRERLAQMADIRALPTDQPRRPGMSGIGRTEWIRVPKEATDAMHDVARAADATLNMTLLALYYVLLSGMAGENDLVVGTPVRARNQTEVESVMGYFNNLLPLHITVDTTLPFIDFVRYVKRAAIESFGHPDVPLEYLQRELRVGAGSGAVLYQALFSFQDARQRIVDWGGLAHEQILLFQSGATEDLGLWFLESNKGMVGGVTYNADILHAETARLLRDRYLTMMARVSVDPQQRVGSLTAIGDGELAQEQAWNATSMTVELPSSVAAMFERQADRVPEKTVLTFGSWGTRYIEIEQRANRIACCLRTRGASVGTVIGLSAEPGINRFAGMLGILKTGSVCVLLDPTDPVARLKEIIADAGISLLVGESALENPLQWPRAQAVWFDADTVEIIGAASDRDAFALEGVDDNVAIVVYVPDADGRPSGAAFTHRAIANACQGLHDSLALSPDDRILATAPPATSEAIIETLLPMAFGAELILASQREAHDGEALIKLTQNHQASAMFAAPEAWQSMVTADWTGRAQMKVVCTGNLPTPDLAQKLAERSAGLWNVSGSADSSLTVSCGRIERPAESLHSGRPLGNTAVWILDGQQHPCPIGAIGEIHVGGVSLSQPFGTRATAHDRGAVTASVVSTDRRLQRTHRRGRWLLSGNIQEMGRTDRRECIHGREVDPATIESELLSQPGVARAVAVARMNQAGSARMDAYVVAAPGHGLDANRLIAALAAALPAHEVPQRLMFVDALPLMANGEVDMAALPLPAESSGDDGIDDSATQPKTANEQLLATLWKELLGVARVRTSDNFFDIGGHSLMAVDMAARVQRQTGMALNLLDIANGTLGTLAAGLSESVVKEPPRPKIGARLRHLFGRG
ncbi:amino acid adenylation domain-containing protein [Dyella monticola]|uniref:Amino acid adenylation domain-containing protein n=1 Tax=Dyella monticola TaxID=1927958 RepID=A0A370X5U7_9GAMM|nr:non-ribosomal peptide synthetase [Dyella monticola]RDS83647.1 amino acid adenylation domain-containing protein [Dyella monticola]